MKDMTLGDILVNPVKPLTSLSVRRNGVWNFESPTKVTKVDNNQTFYLMSNPFGLVKEGVSNPKVWAVKGDPGDYVALYNTGEYCLVTKAEYAMLFPAPNLNPPTIPTNSSQIKDKNFLTNILKGSGSTTSNSKTTKPTSPNTGY